jgi:osmotically-inducible protein OsmY
MGGYVIISPVKAILFGLLVLCACTREVQPVDDSDPGIKARVERALHDRKDVDVRYVTIDVINGVVTISGVVPAHEQVRLIKRLIARTHGVQQVLDNLLVQE